jgi:hypothetical protein
MHQLWAAISICYYLSRLAGISDDVLTGNTRNGFSFEVSFYTEVDDACRDGSSDLDAYWFLHMRGTWAQCFPLP